MNSKFFPFDKPFYKDILFYGFIYLTYYNLSRDLRELVEYGFGNLVFQLIEIILDALLISWVFAILLSGLRLYISNKIEARKSKIRDSKNSDKEQQIILTKFDKPISEMTTDERKAAAQRLTDNFFNHYKDNSNGREI